MHRYSVKSIFISALFSSMLLVTGCSQEVPHADLDRVLDVVSDTLYQFEQNSDVQDESSIKLFTSQLQSNMRAANPSVHPGPIGIQANSDGSFSGFYDKNDNSLRDAGENDLFKVEIDSEKQRLIASDTNGYVRDHSFSGTSLMAGMLIGHMLSRQRAAGVNSRSLSNKQAMSKSQYSGARSRSTSGSHTSGK